MLTDFAPQLLTSEQHHSLKQQALVQAEAAVENARINYMMALAALEALQRDAGPPMNGTGPRREM